MAKKILPRKFWKTEEEITGLSREAFLQKLKKFGEQENIPNISWTAVDLLRFLLSKTQPKKVLEMGCANGFSSIVLADMLQKWNGTLLTGDVSLPSIKSAICNAQACGIENIEFRFGNILETVDASDSPFDFIFIDAQKSWTHSFFSFAKTLLSPSGIIVVDDTQKFPDKMKSFHNLIHREKDEWRHFTVPEENDAIMVFTKKRK